MQKRIPCTIMRGGTSRALFFRREDLPDDIQLQDKILLAALGDPDPFGRLVDGLGGPISSTNKVAIIGLRQGEPNTVDYTFCQGSHTSDLIDRGGNCGNISSAVGPYAIDEGLIEVREPETLVRVYNTNTKKYIIEHVQVEDGKAKVEGDYQIAGVPGTGARVALDFESPGGALTGKLFPTGKLQEKIDAIDVTIIDAANPFVFVRARDLGLKGIELTNEIDSNGELAVRLENIRAIVAVKIGLAHDIAEASVKSPAIPKIALVSPPADYKMTSGIVMCADQVDVVSRMLSMGKVHGAYPTTGAIGTAGAARIEGTIVYEMIPPDQRALPEVRIGHVSGSIGVDATITRQGSEYQYVRGTVYRTARRIMDGYVYIR